MISPFLYYLSNYILNPYLHLLSLSEIINKTIADFYYNEAIFLYRLYFLPILILMKKFPLSFFLLSIVEILAVRRGFLSHNFLRIEPTSVTVVHSIQKIFVPKPYMREKSPLQRPLMSDCHRYGFSAQLKLSPFPSVWTRSEELYGVIRILPFFFILIFPEEKLFEYFLLVLYIAFNIILNQTIQINKVNSTKVTQKMEFFRIYKISKLE
ncbi:hypothetical protein ACJX0J_007604, partial [Zea mays]